MHGCNSIHQIRHIRPPREMKHYQVEPVTQERTFPGDKQWHTRHSQPWNMEVNHTRASPGTPFTRTGTELNYCIAQRFKDTDVRGKLRVSREKGPSQFDSRLGSEDSGSSASRRCNSAVAFLSGILCSPDLWHRSLKVEDWSHRAHPITTPQLTLTSDTAGLSSVTEHICQYPGCLYAGRFQALFFPRFIDPLNNLSSLIFPDKLFPLFLTFPVTLNCLGSFCFCLRWRWHCGLWGGRGSQHLREIFLY